MLESNVFNRESKGEKEISAATYNATIGACLFWGFAVNWWLVVNIDPETLRAINTWIFFIGYFASCFLGVYLFNSSEKPLVSFIGYNFVVAPFGLIMNMVVSQYDQSLVIEAIRITSGVTMVMMILGSIYPKFFEKISGALAVALLAVLVVEIFQIFVLGIHHDWIDWAVAVIFCGYIGYDWGRANQIPKTLDNAVDSAAALYMDIINLFFRILRILGRK
jgi:FtsH-binding integral membrane protein